MPQFKTVLTVTQADHYLESQRSNLDHLLIVSSLYGQIGVYTRDNQRQAVKRTVYFNGTVKLEEFDLVTGRVNKTSDYSIDKTVLDIIRLTVK